MSDSIPTIDTRSYVWKKIIEDEDNPAKVITNDEVKQTLEVYNDIKYNFNKDNSHNI